MKNDEYRNVPYLHIAYAFEHYPKSLADPYVDGNLLIKERLENYVDHTQAATTLKFSRS